MGSSTDINTRGGHSSALPGWYNSTMHGRYNSTGLVFYEVSYNP
jgi:hypothetical protein